MMILKNMPDDKISVIIINFQSKRHLGKCLDSLFQKIFSRIGGEIILVNNDQKENLEEFKRRYENIKIINSGNNVGFGKACNIGAKEANENVLFFLNPDTEIQSESIEAVIYELKHGTDIIGSSLVGLNNATCQWSAGKKISLYDLARNNLHIPRSRSIWDSRNKVETDWVSAAAFFIKKDVFEKLGGFDEKFFMYFEDIDLCRRAKESDCKIIYFPYFSVFHHGGQSYGDKISQKSHYYASQEYYFKKHCGPFQTMLLKILRKIFI